MNNIIVPDQEIMKELDERYENKDWSINEAIELAYIKGYKFALEKNNERGEKNG